MLYGGCTYLLGVIESTCSCAWFSCDCVCVVAMSIDLTGELVLLPVWFSRVVLFISELQGVLKRATCHLGAPRTEQLGDFWFVVSIGTIISE
jgi:hypothetical protein